MLAPTGALTAAVRNWRLALCRRDDFEQHFHIHLQRDVIEVVTGVRINDVMWIITVCYMKMILLTTRVSDGCPRDRCLGDYRHRMERKQSLSSLRACARGAAARAKLAVGAL